VKGQLPGESQGPVDSGYPITFFFRGIGTSLMAPSFVKTGYGPRRQDWLLPLEFRRRWSLIWIITWRAIL